MKSKWQKRWKRARELALGYNRLIQYYDDAPSRTWQIRVDRSARDAYFDGLRDGYKWAEKEQHE